MRNRVLMSLQRIIIPFFLFFIDISAFIIFHHQFLQTLCAYFIIQVLTFYSPLYFIYLFFLLGAEQNIMHGVFGLDFPLYILTLLIGYLIQLHFQVRIATVISLGLGLWFVQGLIYWFWLDYPLNMGFFTDNTLFVNIVVLGVFWSLKLLGRQDNHSFG